MRFEEGTYLDFNDVLLKPKRSTIESRKDVSLSRTFKFRWSDFTLECVPIISSNMTSVTTEAVAAIMCDNNMLSCLPKTYQGVKVARNRIPSVGLTDELSEYPMMLCLDVPTAYLELVVDRTKKLRNLYPAAAIIVGNVVTAEMTEALVLAGADVVKVGIGSGAVCSTRIKTGVGVPQLSAIIECADAAHGLNAHIISDGGCQVPGDVAKAFAAGADMVMLGSMLAGHDENGSRHYGMSSERGNKEIAGGLKDYRASEGLEVELPPRGPLAATLQDILGGLRSACAYTGSKTIKELPKRATFIRVNNQANTSLWGNRV